MLRSLHLRRDATGAAFGAAYPTAAGGGQSTPSKDEQDDPAGIMTPSTVASSPAVSRSSSPRRQDRQFEEYQRQAERSQKRQTQQQQQQQQQQQGNHLPEEDDDRSTSTYDSDESSEEPEVPLVWPVAQRARVDSPPSITFGIGGHCPHQCGSIAVGGLRRPCEQCRGGCGGGGGGGGGASTPSNCADGCGPMGAAAEEDGGYGSDEDEIHQAGSCCGSSVAAANSLRGMNAIMAANNGPQQQGADGSSEAQERALSPAGSGASSSTAAVAAKYRRRRMLAQLADRRASKMMSRSLVVEDEEDEDGDEGCDQAEADANQAKVDQDEDNDLDAELTAIHSIRQTKPQPQPQSIIDAPHGLDRRQLSTDSRASIHSNRSAFIPTPSFLHRTVSMNRNTSLGGSIALSRTGSAFSAASGSQSQHPPQHLYPQANNFQRTGSAAGNNSIISGHGNNSSMMSASQGPPALSPQVSGAQFSAPPSAVRPTAVRSPSPLMSSSGSLPPFGAAGAASPMQSPMSSMDYGRNPPRSVITATKKGTGPLASGVASPASEDACPTVMSASYHGDDMLSDGLLSERDVLSDRDILSDRDVLSDRDPLSDREESSSENSFERGFRQGAQICRDSRGGQQPHMSLTRQIQQLGEEQPTEIPPSNSMSSGSQSLPALISPGYKFTPIDSFDSSVSSVGGGGSGSGSGSGGRGESRLSQAPSTLNSGGRASYQDYGYGDEHDYSYGDGGNGEGERGGSKEQVSGGGECEYDYDYEYGDEDIRQLESFTPTKIMEGELSSLPLGHGGHGGGQRVGVEITPPPKVDGIRQGNRDRSTSDPSLDDVILSPQESSTEGEEGADGAISPWSVEEGIAPSPIQRGGPGDDSMPSPPPQSKPSPVGGGEGGGSRRQRATQRQRQYQRQPQSQEQRQPQDHRHPPQELKRQLSELSAHHWPDGGGQPPRTGALCGAATGPCVRPISSASGGSGAGRASSPDELHWSLFDLPLLLSRCICDWADHPSNTGVSVAPTAKDGEYEYEYMSGEEEDGDGDYEYEEEPSFVLEVEGEDGGSFYREQRPPPRRSPQQREEVATRR